MKCVFIWKKKEILKISSSAAPSGVELRRLASFSFGLLGLSLAEIVANIFVTVGFDEAIQSL